ncbi:hypothetical protein O4H53_05530 [Sulfitobacter sp. G21635-S1]|uniref:hypothetical protein n=1 Tax=Sulfitobacter sp. G21635-S1 TaxID=3014043 RepID=UPI0022AF6CFD|nr:hypothetical protein [Sulfitobacter sp. G21635-S1]MCZ4254989.1 hypothetical protein [Sulfitobacter sp. G21635-S1]
MDQVNRQKRIMWWSRILAAATLVLAVALPPLVFITVLLLPFDMLAASAHVVPPPSALSSGTQLLIALVASLPALLLSWGLWALRPALISFGRGACFAPVVFGALKRFAVALFVSALMRVAVVPLTGVILSIGQEQGALSLRFGMGDLQTMLLAAGVWILAWIIVEAAALDAENKQFV